MHFHSNRRLPVLLTLTLFGLSATVETQHSSHSSEVVLDLRTMAVEHAPALQVDDPSHQRLLSTTNGSRSGHVRVGQFDTDASVSIGGVEILLAEPEAVETNSSTLSALTFTRYDLWLTSANGRLDLAGWRTFKTAQRPRRQTSWAPSGLPHTTVAVSSPTFVAGLVPTGNNEARLLLRWGTHEWRAVVRFLTPREFRPRERDPLGDQRTFEFDTSEIQRSNRLTRRNMTTVWLPDGSRLGVVYGRNMTVEGRDFAHLVSVATNRVVTTTASAVTRLDIDVPLQFGDVTLGTGNVGGLRGSPRGAMVSGSSVQRMDGGSSSTMSRTRGAASTTRRSTPARSVSPTRRRRDSSRAMSASVVMTTPNQGAVRARLGTTRVVSRLHRVLLAAALSANSWVHAPARTFPRA